MPLAYGHVHLLEPVGYSPGTAVTMFLVRPPLVGTN